MRAEAQIFDNIVVMVKQLSPRYRLRLLEVLTQTLWDILPPKTEKPLEPTQQQLDFIERTAGAWQGDTLVRPDQGEFEHRLEL